MRRKLRVDVVGIAVVAIAIGLLLPNCSLAIEHKYVQQSTLLLVYKQYINNAETKADGTHPQYAFTDAEIAAVKTHPKIVSDLIWRGSQFRVHLKYTDDAGKLNVIVPKDPLTEADIAESWLDAKRIVKDLADYGYRDGSFGLILVVWPIAATEKYYNWAGGLPGASNGAIYLPKTRCAVCAFNPGGNVLEAYWVMLHEDQHVFDDWFGGATGLGWGEQEYPNADDNSFGLPWPSDSAGMACFLAMKRVSVKKWEDWLILAKPGDPCGVVKVLPDADGDGLPDSDPDNEGIAVTEATMGSDPTKADTDGDGVSDKDEAIGDHTGSYNPTSTDTDSDGLPDAIDSSPNHPSVNTMPRKTPTIDGKIDASEYAKVSTFHHGDGLSGTTYAAWNDRVLYLAASIDDDRIVTDSVKPENNDGVRWMLDIDNDGYGMTQELGMLNYWIRVTPGSDGRATVLIGNHLQTSGVDDDPRVPIDGVQSACKIRPGGYDIEVAIPEANLVGATFMNGRHFRMGQAVLDNDGGKTTISCDPALVGTPADLPMFAPYFIAYGLRDKSPTSMGVVDTTPPTPNPATFAAAPKRVGNKITMEATEGRDENGPVEYCFVECWGRKGRVVRGWSKDPTFEFTTEAPEEYRYVVYMRDALGNTTHSAPATIPAPPGTKTE